MSKHNRLEAFISIKNLYNHTVDNFKDIMMRMFNYLEETMVRIQESMIEVMRTLKSTARTEEFGR